MQSDDYLERLFARARRRLDLVQNAPCLPADAMFHLNRMAKGRYAGAQVTYALKNLLIEQFYREGFCTSAMMHIQTFACWDCDEHGVDMFGDVCGRCGGTHIYRQVELYRFVFEIEGRRFSWHQPKSMVSWPVTLTDDTAGSLEERPLPVESDRHQVRKSLYLAIVAEWLHRRGVQLPDWISSMGEPWPT